jgi:subtilisin family serine protease
MMGLGAGIALLAFGIYQYKKDRVISYEPLINSDPLIRKTNTRGIASTGRRPKRRQDAVLIKMKSDATPEQIDALKAVSAQWDLRQQKKFHQGTLRLHAARRVQDDQEEEIAEKIYATGAVEFAEPDYVLHPALIPNDSLYSYQWHHKKIQSELAWNYTLGAPRVLVAVCDAGFDLTHPDLAPHLVLPGYNTVKNTSQIDDINDHGTQTAGTLAAIGNNGMGVAGMAWQVRILPIQISDQPDGVSTFSDVVECINYAKDHGAKVVNLSYDAAYASSLVSDAALAMRKAGGMVVVAAGNSTMDISPWGPSPNLLVVGASDQDDKLTWFTNYGTPVDLFAPGLDIYTTAAGGAYAMVSGTSFSTPVTAGTVALLYSLNPAATPEQIEGYLNSTLANVGLPAGRLNVGGAVQKANQDKAAPPPIILDNLAANSSDSFRISKGKWCLSNQTGAFGNASVYSCGSGLDTYRFIPNILKAGAYKVSIRYLSAPTLSRHAPVVIKFGTSSATKRVNMQTHGGQWLQLGTFSLSTGTSNYVQLSDSAGAVNVDGVKFEFVPAN